MALYEAITHDGICLKISDHKDQMDFEEEVLKNMHPEAIRKHFITQMIVDYVKKNHESSNGSNGTSIVDMLKPFSVSDLKAHIDPLIDKKILIKRESVNDYVYFIHPKHPMAPSKKAHTI